MAVTSAAPAAGAARRLRLVAWALWALAMVGHAAMLWLDDLLRQVGRPELT
jgi:putative copper export protein